MFAEAVTRSSLVLLVLIASCTYYEDSSTSTTTDNNQQDDQQDDQALTDQECWQLGFDDCEVYNEPTEVLSGSCEQSYEEGYCACEAYYDEYEWC